MIYTSKQSERILDAINTVMLANNGYADIGTDTVVASALQQAGFSVIFTVDLAGRGVYRAFTKKAQNALREEPFGTSTYQTVCQKIDTSWGLEDILLAKAEGILKTY